MAVHPQHAFAPMVQIEKRVAGFFQGKFAAPEGRLVFAFRFPLSAFVLFQVSGLKFQVSSYWPSVFIHVHKTISPGPTLRSDRDKWGMGVRHALFPEPALGAPLRGCRLPDAILHGKRSYRPRSRAVRHFAARGF
jgi:hypothetical protein